VTWSVQPEQFFVARHSITTDSEHNIIACVQLKPYTGFCELVSRLLESHQGALYLICEDAVVDFFRQFGFDLITQAVMLAGLKSKVARYTAEAWRINVMKRD